MSGTGVSVAALTGEWRSINRCGLARVTIADICLSPLEPWHQAARVLGRLSSSFLAPQTLHTRWLATSGTGMRFGKPDCQHR